MSQVRKQHSLSMTPLNHRTYITLAISFSFVCGSFAKFTPKIFVEGGRKTPFPSEGGGVMGVVYLSRNYLPRNVFFVKT
jgi:hypothetical protein